MHRPLIPFLFLCLPLTALAASSASFASQSVFLSRSSVTEGESVTAYSNVANNSGALFNGTIVFAEGPSSIGTESISLPAGEAGVASVSWQPDPGLHTITATLKNAAGANLAKASVNLNVAAKITPSSPSGATTTIQSSAGLESQIARLSPQVASATAPLFNSIDSLRTGAARILDAQVAKAQKNLPGQFIGGTGSTTATAHLGLTDWIFNILWTLYFYLLTIVRNIDASIFFFYPILVFLFFYTLYKIYRGMSRPRYRY